jgi:nicotinate-nucleotide--dimethylbenzimidazole phosphoribosyltransferase
MIQDFYLAKYLAGIEPVSAEFRNRAEERENSLTKPPGSLGRLEELAVALCGVQRTLEPRVANPAITIFAADHGVCAEKVNPYPQSVTRQMLANFLAGGAAINAIAGSVDARLVLVDVGVLGPPIEHPNLVSRRVASGSKNFCEEAAMSTAEALAAIQAGIDCAEAAIQDGSTLLAIGEMGIGNTTVASAICAALTNLAPEDVCGVGTGSDEFFLARKRDAVRRGLELHRAYLSDPLHLLSRLGGLEIAAMCGACIGAARHRCAILMDGFISTAAAAIAYQMNSDVGPYLIAAHESTEPGHHYLLQLLNARPLLRLDMRLGEGTGAALAIPLVRAAVATFRSMATFGSAGVDQGGSASDK